MKDHEIWLMFYFFADAGRLTTLEMQRTFCLWRFSKRWGTP